MTEGTLTDVLVIALAATLAPLLADRLRRWLPVPSTVLEIMLGILVGPAVLGLARTGTVVDAAANLGLAILFFLAGYEIEFGRIRGTPVRRALGSWAGSLLLGLACGALLAVLLGGGIQAALVFGLALVTTALGTILPIVRDSGVLPSRYGAMIMAVGAVGEFGPIILVTLLLSGQRPVHVTVVLLGFSMVAVVAAAAAARPLPDRMARLLTETLATSTQFAVRLSVLVVLTMVWLATELHLDLVLGAFAAGIVIRLVLASVSRREAAVVESKLEGIGFGMLIPFFFVTTGVRFDLESLLDSPAALALLPAGLLGFLLVRGFPVAIAFRRELPRPELTGLSLYAATALPMVVVVIGIGVDNGWLSPASGAGLVGAAMLSVLAFPLVAQQVPEPASRPAG